VPNLTVAAPATPRASLQDAAPQSPCGTYTVTTFTQTSRRRDLSSFAEAAHHPLSYVPWSTTSFAHSVGHVLHHLGHGPRHHSRHSPGGHRDYQPTCKRPQERRQHVQSLVRAHFLHLPCLPIVGKPAARYELTATLSPGPGCRVRRSRGRHGPCLSSRPPAQAGERTQAVG
jgi:hypothetical protein